MSVVISALVVASIVFTLLGAIVLGASNIAYWLWIFIGAINSIFNSFQYIGASCELILTFQTTFYVAFPIFIILFIWNKVKT